MTGRARARRSLAAALAAGVLAPALLTGCAQSVDPIERLGRKAAEKVPERKPAADRCGQALREARRAATAPPAGPLESGRDKGTETEPPTAETRCPEGRDAASAAPERTPPK
ncbi:hypothetical protein [Streptomyces sp. NPDC055060]